MANKEIKSGPGYPPPFKTELIQTSVIVGCGETQKLVVKVSTVSPPSPPIFRVVDVDSKVVITNTKLIPPEDKNDDKNDHKCWGKVIVDGYVDKNVIYKTITDSTSDAVNGPVYQFTTRLDFATFVDVEAHKPFGKHARVEILKAFVEGAKEEPIDPNPPTEGAPSWAITYNKLLEKIVVKIELKVTEKKHLPVLISPWTIPDGTCPGIPGGWDPQLPYGNGIVPTPNIDSSTKSTNK